MSTWRRQKPDDSHRSMGWEPDLIAFRGVNLKGDFFVMVRVIDWAVELVREERILRSFEVEGRSLSGALKIPSSR